MCVFVFYVCLFVSICVCLVSYFVSSCSVLFRICFRISFCFSFFMYLFIICFVCAFVCTSIVLFCFLLICCAILFRLVLFHFVFVFVIVFVFCFCICILVCVDLLRDFVSSCSVSFRIRRIRIRNRFRVSFCFRVCMFSYFASFRIWIRKK